MKPVLVAAVGSNGHQILGLLHGRKEAKLVGVAEIEPSRLAALEKDLPGLLDGVPRFDSLEALLGGCDAELISVCSARRDRQADQILACLRAGRHVLAEKPLCTTLTDLRRIRAAAKRARRQVWAMLTMVVVPVVRDFARRVRRGEIGEVGHVFAQKSYKFGGNRPQDRGVDGGITQATIHAIAFVRATTGLEFAEVAALESAVGNDKPGRLQVEFALQARMNNGALCQITTNYLNPPCAPWWGNDQLRIFGTQGMLEAVDGFSRLAVYRGSKPRWSERKPEHPNYLPQLFRALRQGTPPPWTMEDSLRCTQIAIEAQLSASEGGRLRKLLFPS